MFTNKLSNAAFLLLASSLTAAAQTPFVITNVNSQMALDVPNFSTADTLIKQYPPNGATNQEWVLHRIGANPAYAIQSVSSGLVLSPDATSPGNQISQVTANGSPMQLWTFYQATGDPGYQLVTADPFAPLVLEIQHQSTQSGGVLQENRNYGGIYQQWLFHPAAGVNVRVNGVLKEEPPRYILIDYSPASLTISGWNFQAGTEACPFVFSTSPAIAGSHTCTTVLPNGTFLYDVDVTGLRYGTNGSNTIVAIEDNQQNLLALGSFATVFFQGLR